MTQETLPDRQIRQCLVCDHEALPAMRGYEKDHLVRCERCGFVFANQRPTQEELDVVYGRYTRRYERTAATLAKMQATADELAARTGARRVLDIACGDGTFVSMFRGCETYGTEYDTEVEELARSKGVHTLPGGLLPEVPPELLGTFDLVIFTEVIEHINHPQEVLAHISRLLKVGGCLYITTPNFASLERRILGPAWGMISYPEHIAFWSPRTLDRLLRQGGYTRVFNRSENLSVFRIVQFLNDRTRREGTALDPTQVSDAAQEALGKHAVLGSLKQGANHLLRLSGSGSSLIALYRKGAG